MPKCVFWKAMVDRKRHQTFLEQLTKKLDRKRVLCLSPFCRQSQHLTALIIVVAAPV
jgi:hypothetical protein